MRRGALFLLLSPNSRTMRCTSCTCYAWAGPLRVYLSDMLPWASASLGAFRDPPSQAPRLIFHTFCTWTDQIFRQLYNLQGNFFPTYLIVLISCLNRHKSHINIWVPPPHLFTHASRSFFAEMRWYRGEERVEAPKSWPRLRLNSVRHASLLE